MNLIHRKRGVSGIIGGLFLVVVTVMIFGAMAAQYGMFERYNETVEKAQQRAWERFNEKLYLSSWEKGVTKLDFKVKNYGSVTAHIVDVYLEFVNGTRTRFSVNLWVNPGGTVRIFGAGPNLLANDQYYFQIATERGNLVGPTEATISNVIRPGASQPMPFVFGFGYQDFQYWTGSEWKEAWALPSGSIIAGFRVFLNNTYDISTTLQDPHTRLGIVLDDFQSANKQYAIIEGNQVIPAKSGIYVYFGALGSKLTSNSHHYVFIELFYKLEGSTQLMGTTCGVLAVIST
jgi:hypothetical protein